MNPHADIIVCRSRPSLKSPRELNHAFLFQHVFRRSFVRSCPPVARPAPTPIATAGRPHSTDTAKARDGLMGEQYGLSQEQADAILALRLGRLTSMEEGKLKEEAQELKATMER